MAQLWAKWLRHPCRLGDPHRFGSRGEIRSGPLVGKVATPPLPSWGSPPLQSGREIRSGPFMGKVAMSPLPSQGSLPLRKRGRNQKWPTSGQSGYVAPAVSGIPTASKRGLGNQKWPTCGECGYVTPAVSGIPTAAERARKSEVAHKWANWLRHPCRLGYPHRCRAEGGGGIRSGPVVGKLATSPLPSRGSPPLQSGGGGG